MRYKTNQSKCGERNYLSKSHGNLHILKETTWRSIIADIVKRQNINKKED